LIDREWTDWLPIYAYAIEHPEDGVSPDDSIAAETLRRIQTFVRERPTVYLVAHDPESATRLIERRAAVAAASTTAT
jgi:hypothetical protein